MANIKSNDVRHMDIRNVLLSKIKSEVAKTLEASIDTEIESHLEEIKRNGTIKYYLRNEKRLLNLLHGAWTMLTMLGALALFFYFNKHFIMELENDKVFE